VKATHRNAAGAEYDRLAEVYDQRWRRYIDVTLDALLQWLDPCQGQRILDLACGTGELERAALARWPNLEFVGLDLSRQMLRRARAKLGSEQTLLIQGDTGHLPLETGSFDHVVTANSFHCFQTPHECLAEIHRVLRPGGRLTLVDWCDDYWTCKVCGLWLRLTDPAHFRTYTLRACTSMLEAAGFTVRRAERFRTLAIWGLMRVDCVRAE